MRRPTFSLVAALVSAVLATSAIIPATPTRAVTPTGTCAGRSPTILGTGDDDVLIGTSGPDVIVGLAGTDSIRGLGGDDILCGGAGVDVLMGGAGDDRMLGGLGESVLRGGAGDDVMIGSLVIGTGAQSVKGGPGRDRWFMRFVTELTATLDGVTGQVNLRRELARAESEDRMAEMSVLGIEEVEVRRGRWTLVGSGLDETLLGHTGRGAPVTIHAGAGRDVVRGTIRRDLLDGGAGVDTVLPTGGDDCLVSIERRS